MTALFALWRLARPLLPYIGAALAIVAAVVWIDHRAYQRGFHKRDPEIVSLNLTIAGMKAASEAATAANLAHVKAVETRDAQINKEQTDALSKQLVDARASVAAYMRRMRPPAAQAGAGESALPEAPPAPGAADAADRQAVVPLSDLNACADAYVIATGWQAWYRRVQDTER